MSEENNEIDFSTPFPVLPLRDVVVFPHMVIPLFVGREKSIAALEQAMEHGKHIALVAQHDAAQEDPGEKDIFNVGVLANILQLLKLPDGTVKVLVEGKTRIKFQHLFEEGCFTAVVEKVTSSPIADREQEVAIKTLMSEFENYSKINSKVAPEAMGQLKSIDDVERLVDTIAGFLELKLDEKQQLLEVTNVDDRLDSVLSFMESELDMHRVEKKFAGVSKNRWKRVNVSII
jgi:ATP-dependent Lon protease